MCESTSQYSDYTAATCKEYSILTRIGHDKLPFVIGLVLCVAEGTHELHALVASTWVLEDLNLFDNSLTGPIPAAVFNLSSLNQLSVSLPTSLPNFAKLEKISVCQQFHRKHSNGDRKLDTAIFYLGLDSLNGELPSAIFNISTLVDIDVSFNQIFGRFPNDPCHLSTKLEVFYLFNNQIYGQVPSSISHCLVLKELNLSHNLLTESLPMASETYQRFNGNIPNSIGNMSNLEIFHVGSNSIQGHSPEKLGVLSNMKELFIGQNKLEGEIPEFIFKPFSLQALSLVDNYVKIFQLQ
ncbi:Hypothetical predicted protein [Olea europaea subsp. europaea]|uniref:Uncharacterized protein n=1 Tax=Olea europaea subsp. europaea TaxID=158383 RepID=A0A8S0R5V3_OLEEU|nr:Hypothetical predicted protein [Olea europaea subsp. europaea]